MSDFPASLAALKAAGYLKANNGQCHGCFSAIEWWVTPSGKKMPFNPMPTESSEPIAHFATCPFSKDYRKRK